MTKYELRITGECKQNLNCTATARGSGSATSSLTGSLFGSRTKQNSFLYW